MIAICACAAFCAASPESAAVAPIPFNMAEAIVEAFWSPEIGGFDKWQVDPGEAHGLLIKQNWSAVNFEWASKPGAGPALRMTRDFDVDCTGYDRLLVKLAVPKEAVFRIIALTDKGPRTFTSPPSPGKEVEYALELDGAALVNTITLEIEAATPGDAAGWLRWIALHNSKMLDRYLARWDYSGMCWDAYIKDDSYEPKFKPLHGIFMTAGELEELRAEHAGAVKKHGRSRYTDIADSARRMEFEKGIHEFANSGGGADMHGRARDANQAPLPGKPELAEAGLVLRDADTLRAAARYALSMCMSEHWEHGFMSCFPGGPWEDRAFRRSYMAEDVAKVLDLAGEIFTDAGRIYLMRRLAEEGIGPINYVTWRHEYIFHCNQLAYFNIGRMYAYLAIEREWPRVKPYTDLAYEDTLDNLRTVIMPDGGYLEGPSYLAPTIRGNYHALKYYARARDKDLSSIVPNVLKRTAGFAALIASTTGNDVIPVCDAGSSFQSTALKILAELVPESHWTAMYNKQCLREGREPLSEQGPALPAFIALPDTGPLASTRALGNHLVKILVMGHKAGADHTHEDKGSFVLEFAGQTFALDLGICEYDDPMHHRYKQCQRHNMLVPVGMSERAHPRRPILADVKPDGSGDETKFRASIDATPGWKGYYKKWVRTWDSPSPETLVIRDEYELAKGDGVEFYWQTMLPCSQEGRTVTIAGERGAVTLTAPEGCPIRIETFLLVDGEGQRRIAIRKDGSSGVLEVSVKLTPADT